MNTQFSSYEPGDERQGRHHKESDIYDSGYLLNFIETQFAGLQCGTNALATKSFRSARLTLFKQLAAGRPLRILSYEHAAVWNCDNDIYKRYKIEVVYRQNFADISMAEIIRNEKIDLLYLSAIDTESLSVENHPRLIAEAHAHNVPVVYDNTLALGTFYQPLAAHADYVLINTSSTVLGGSGIGGIIVEGAHIRSLSGFAKQEYTPVTKLKKRREAVKKQRFFIPGEGRAFIDKFNKQLDKFSGYANVCHTLAKWLNQEAQVSTVNYPGLKTSVSYNNAETLLKGGYGYALKFRLWDNDFSYNLVKSFLVAGRPEGLIISTDNEKKEFRAEIRTADAEYILSYFQRIFFQLGKELEYRAILKKQMRLQEAINEIFSK